MAKDETAEKVDIYALKSADGLRDMYPKWITNSEGKQLIVKDPEEHKAELNKKPAWGGDKK